MLGEICDKRQHLVHTMVPWQPAHWSPAYTDSKVLADFAVCDIKFSQIEGNCQKFSHIDISNSVTSKMFQHFDKHEGRYDTKTFQPSVFYFIEQKS